MKKQRRLCADQLEGMAKNDWYAVLHEEKTAAQGLAASGLTSAIRRRAAQRIRRIEHLWLVLERRERLIVKMEGSLSTA